ncbi:hypothetical protein [Streptomyces sp. NPDC026673]|uniref:hypothetical protein n=1 Tax=Streptomyces sp. NPDC026673 TaxID=3155724 RepID=UPI00340FD07C
MRRALAPAAGCAAVAALLAGCGVPESAVVEAGGPATTVVYPSAGNRLVLFFLADDGRPAVVVRQLGEYNEQSPPIPTAKVMSALLDGPLPEEREEAGLTTGLPEPTGPVDVRNSPGALWITAPFPVRKLRDNALRQLVCTAAAAEGRDGTAVVTLTGSDGTLPPARCDVAASPGPTG